MLIKVICTVLFLGLCYLFSRLGNIFKGKLTEANFLEPKARLTQSFFALCTLLIIFFQFSLLTFHFPLIICLLIVGLSLLTHFSNNVVAGFLGLSIRAQFKKVQLLSLTGGLQVGLANRFTQYLLSIMGLLIFAAWGAALVLFWIYPVESSLKNNWVLFLLFFSPQAAGIAQSLVLNIPILSSEYTDDDYRDYVLSQSFTQLLMFLLPWMIPYLAVQIRPDLFSISLPPLWIWMSIPLLYFALTVLLPFFIGVNKHKAQRKYFLNWREGWISDTLSAIHLSNYGAKVKAVESSVRRLQKETEEMEAKDQLYQFYYAVDQSDELAVNAGLNDQAREIYQRIADNKRDIIRWNIQLQHLAKLKELNENVKPDNLSASKDFLNYQLGLTKSDLSGISSIKNNLSGITLALISSVIAFLLKEFQDPINTLLKTIGIGSIGN